MTAAPVSTLTIEQQADYVDAVVRRCHSYTGKNAGPVLLSLDIIDVEIMRALAARLRRMAPHEPEIKRIVVGR